MPTAVCGGWHFWIVVIPISVTVHQKLRAPYLKITHGFISKLDADSGAFDYEDYAPHSAGL